MSYQMHWDVVVYKVSNTGGNAGYLAQVGYIGPNSGAAGKTIITSQSKAISMCHSLIKRFQESTFVNCAGWVGGQPIGAANDGKPDLNNDQKQYYVYNRMDTPNPALLLAIRKANAAVAGDGDESNGGMIFGNFTDNIPETEQSAQEVDGGDGGVITG